MQLKNMRYETVEVVAQRAGKNGGKQLLIQRYHPALPWALASGFVRHVAPQGDPRWFVTLFGKKLSSYFGFRILSKNKILLPDCREINGAIRKFNAGLRSPDDPLHLNVKFYAFFGKGKVGDETYFKKFTDDLLLPISSASPEFHHDINYHVAGAILIPSSWHEHARKASRALQILFGKSEASLPRSAKRALLLVRNEDVDFGAASPHVFMMSETGSYEENMLRLYLMRYLCQGVSPAEHWDICLRREGLGRGRRQQLLESILRMPGATDKLALPTNARELREHFASRLRAIEEAAD